MAALFEDGFDGYDAATDLTTYGGYNLVGTGVAFATGRTGVGKALDLVGGGSGVAGYAMKAFDSNQADNTLYATFAYKDRLSSACHIFEIYETVGNTKQFYLNRNSSGKIELIRGATVLATGTISINTGAYLNIQVKFLVHNSAGIIEVKVEGVLDISYSGNTQGAGTNAVNAWCLGWYDGGYTFSGYFDDFAICNNLGSANNTYLGDVVVEEGTATSDSSTQWTRSIGTDSYANINAALGSPNETTYNYDSVAGHVDNYGITDVTTNATIKWVSIITRAKKIDVGTQSYTQGFNSGGTVQVAAISPGIGLANYRSSFETSDGTNAWTPTTYNAALARIGIP